MKERKQKSNNPTPPKKGEQDPAPAENYWQQNAQKGRKQRKYGKFDSQPHSVGKKFWRQ